jgi:hypothetical protein
LHEFIDGFLGRLQTKSNIYDLSERQVVGTISIADSVIA